MLRIFIVLSVVVTLINSQSNEEIDPTIVQDEDTREGHMAVIRPDYTLWKMVKVLKNMFDSRTEKRRQRDLDVREGDDEIRDQPIREQALRARRLLFSF